MWARSAAGQLAKACNNLLHWAHCVSNYETLLLAKRFGIDAQRMREVLLECPAYNTTLKRWDTTRFTWQEKDMDLTMDLAQMAGLVAAAGRPDRPTRQIVIGGRRQGAAVWAGMLLSWPHVKPLPPKRAASSSPWGETRIPPLTGRGPPAARAGITSPPFC